MLTLVRIVCQEQQTRRRRRQSKRHGVVAVGSVDGIGHAMDRISCFLMDLYGFALDQVVEQNWIVLMEFLLKTSTNHKRSGGCGQGEGEGCFARHFHDVEVLRAMKAAACANRLHLLQLLFEYAPWICLRRSCFVELHPFDWAAQSGHPEIVQWFCECQSKHLTSRALIKASGAGQLHVVQLLVTKQREMELREQAQQEEEGADASGATTTTTTTSCCWMGRMTSIHPINEERRSLVPSPTGTSLTTHSKLLLSQAQEAAEEASAQGHLQVVEYLVEQDLVQCVTCLIKKAMLAGHLPIVQRLKQMDLDRGHDQQNHAVTRCRKRHVVSAETCLDALEEDHANKQALVEKGGLPVFEWLVNRFPCLRWDPEFLILAASSGSLPLVSWLYERLKQQEKLHEQEPQLEPPQQPQQLPHPMRRQSSFREHTKSSYTLHDVACQAAEAASGKGHLDIVKFFIHKGHAPLSLDAALLNGHVEVVKYLKNECGQKPKCSRQIADLAAFRSRQTELVRVMDSQRGSSLGLSLGFQWSGATGGGGCCHSRSVAFEIGERGSIDMLKMFFFASHNVPGAHATSGNSFFTHENCLDALRGAIKNGQFEAVKYLYYTSKRKTNWWNSSNWFMKMMLKNLPKLCIEKLMTSLKEAAKNGHFEVILFLISREPISKNCNFEYVIDAAIWKKQFALLKLLHDKQVSGFSKENLNVAAASGCLRLVRFFHEKRTEGCTSKAMNCAATGGFLRIVEFLHANRHEGCTFRAMDGAAKNGHLQIVKFLHQHRKEGCSLDAVHKATRSGHFEVVKYLFKHFVDRTSSRRSRHSLHSMHGIHGIYAVNLSVTNVEDQVLRIACEEGHLEIVQWLVLERHQHVSEEILRLTRERQEHDGDNEDAMEQTIEFLEQQFAQEQKQRKPQRRSTSFWL